MSNRTYIAIDLKSFYASVECVERGLNPLTTNLVVADETRTEKTICLAVSPSLKAYGIPGRARLFEVVSIVGKANAIRKSKAGGNEFKGSSYDSTKLSDPGLSISYITAVPRMSLYMQYSTRIYDIYLKYVAPEDMHVYSVDEVFIDVTGYLKTYGMTAHELAKTMILDVFKSTGITATAGIGTNMYLCKIAMDIVAKHIPADKDGVRIASLDEMEYRRLLWNHRPITDFWRVGPGYAKKLYEYGIYTMGDVARCSLGSDRDFYNEELLYNAFGVNAQLLIDHAWGYEPCTIKDIKEYKPQDRSLGAGQVLTCPYESDKARVVVIEMADQLALELYDKGVVTDQIVLTLGYDIDNMSENSNYKGATVTDRYGRRIPKHAHGSENLPSYTSSSQVIIKAVSDLYDRIVDKELHIRRLNISASHIISSKEAEEKMASYRQLNLFEDFTVDNARDKREQRIKEAELSIKHKYGKNAILKGINFKEGATARERNGQIGGHKA